MKYKEGMYLADTKEIHRISRVYKFPDNKILYKLIGIAHLLTTEELDERFVIVERIK